MGISVFISFRTPAPSIAVIFAALTDIVITLAVINLLVLHYQLRVLLLSCLLLVIVLILTFYLQHGLLREERANYLIECGTP